MKDKETKNSADEKIKKIALSYYRKKLLRRLHSGSPVSKRTYKAFVRYAIFKYADFSDVATKNKFTAVVDYSWNYALNHFKAKRNRFYASKKIQALIAHYANAANSKNLMRALEYAYMSDLVRLNQNDIKNFLTSLQLAFEEAQAEEANA